MDFDAIIKKATKIHCNNDERGLIPSHSCTNIDIRDGCATEEVFGRICSTEGPPPNTLSTSPGRRTVFVFGPDSVNLIILKQNAYECLQSLGFDQEYIYHEVVEEKAQHWLVLFTRLALKHQGDIVSATWEGSLQIIKTLYPEAYKDTLLHLDELRSRSLCDFEQEAGIKFLDAKRNIDGNHPSLPVFHNYKHFLSLPRPVRAWQVRLFLYCELRFLSLFKGDGYTYQENGTRVAKEYLCQNFTLDALDQTQLAILPMTVSIPQ